MVRLCLQVNCELDRAGLGAFAFNAIEFSCPVDQNKEPNIQVGRDVLYGLVPACAACVACLSLPGWLR